MRIYYLVLFLTLGMFAGQGWAPPPGQGGSPSKINMPKDQPGYEAIDKGKNLDKDSGWERCCRGKECQKSPRRTDKCTQILDRYRQPDSCKGSPC